MRNLSKHLGGQLEEEKQLISTLGQTFDKSKEMLGKAMNSLDGMVTRASGSSLPYIILFTIMILALIFKLQ
jgi:hypothetical protein